MIGLLELFLVVICVIIFFKVLEPFSFWINKKYNLFLENLKIQKQSRLYEVRGFILLGEGYTLIEMNTGTFMFVKKGHPVFFEDELRGFSDLRFNEKINEKINKG